MKAILSVLLLFVLVILTAASSKKSSSSRSMSDAERAAARFESVALMEGQIIPINDGNFTRYIVDRPRQYGVAIMFTATSPKFQCYVCLKAKMTFAEAAALYAEQYNIREVATDKRLAFFVVEVDDSRETFGSLGLETVPRLFVLPPREASDPKLSFSDFEVDMHSVIEGMSSLLKSIEGKSNIKIVETMDPMPLLVLLCFAAIAVAWVVGAAADDVNKAIFWYQSPKLWNFVSLICFAVGVSGCIYCIIRSAPLYGMSRQGMRVFSNQGRDQYLLEGIIIAAVTVGCGIAGLIMYYSTKVPFTLVRHIGVIFGLSMFVVLLLEIWQPYTEKTRWYQIKETMPPQVWAWISASVKKTSGLPKRLWRLSEFWLTEYKDYDGLEKKAKQLVVDYLVRQWEALVSPATAAN